MSFLIFCLVNIHTSLRFIFYFMYLDLKLYFSLVSQPWPHFKITCEGALCGAVYLWCLQKVFKASPDYIASSRPVRRSALSTLVRPYLKNQTKLKSVKHFLSLSLNICLGWPWTIFPSHAPQNLDYTDICNYIWPLEIFFKMMTMVC